MKIPNKEGAFASSFFTQFFTQFLRIRGGLPIVGFYLLDSRYNDWREAYG